MNSPGNTKPVPPDPPEQDSEILPPSLDEVKDSIKKLKNNKAPGVDGITSKVVKAGCSVLASYLHTIIVNIWRDEKLPSDFLDKVLCPIYKNGDKLNCSNYSEISLLNTAYKVLDIEQ